MSLLGWFTRKPSADSIPDSTPGAGDSTRPSALAGAGDAAPGSSRSERTARRAQLFGVVRECMVNAGVLSSSYKFKVLSLDSRGRQFLVMVDLGRAHDSPTGRLAGIEAAIVQSAQVRHSIQVKAVYWRSNAHAAAAAAERVPAPAAPASPEASATAAPAEPRHADEPIGVEEIAAFRQALADGSGRQAARAFDGAPVQGPQSYTLLTGFEDTEIRDNRSPSTLSGTQPGDLR